MMKQLSELKENETAVIESADLSALSDSGAFLKEIGFVSGTVIKCLHRSFSGDPTAYLIKGAVIALRRSDSDKIKCRII
ncbi:MAG: ferrous iron transport protein A [Ruminococcus sp.]|nr:ferrous iron transport protein A [Ruminococcus sp.]MDE7226592.1 ferrous iron transport protein A [Ruminococcus sp.]